MNQPFVRTHIKLWTTHFVKILSVVFAIGVCNQIQITTLPLYAQHIGGSKTIAGLMMGIFTISALVFRPLVGAILDRKGRRLVLITGAAVAFAASLSYYFVGVIWLLLLLRFIHGAGFSAYSTSTGTIVSDVVPRLRLMEGIGYYGIAAVPTMYIYILQTYLENPQKYNLKAWRNAQSAGAAMPAEYITKIEESFGVNFCENYGATETSTTATYGRLGHGRVGSIQ